MSFSLCQACHERAASVFITKAVKGHTHKQQLCEVCAREQAAGFGLFSDLPDELAETLQGHTMEEIVSHLLDPSLDQPLATDKWEESDPFAGDPFSGEFPGDEELVDEIEEAASQMEGKLVWDDDVEDTGSWHAAMRATPPIAARRCPRCDTSWDRLRQEGRAGCPYCYTAFAGELRGVMERLQRGATHVGKRPRAAEKRRRRLEQLRVQRDNRLALLQKRLREAVAAERYEEAAELRDKIRVVTSTYVGGQDVPELR